MKKYTEIFKALSNETRLTIMVILNQQELCVCQIESFLKLSQVKVSRHLTLLKYAGLVKCRREGLWMYYSIAKPKNKVENKMFELLHEIEVDKKELKIIKSQLKVCEKC